MAAPHSVQKRKGGDADDPLTGQASASQPARKTAAAAHATYGSYLILDHLWDGVFALMQHHEHCRYAMICDTWGEICLRLLRLNRSVEKLPLYRVPVTPGFAAYIEKEQKVTENLLKNTGRKAAEADNQVYVCTILSQTTDKYAVETLADRLPSLGTLKMMQLFEKHGLGPGALFNSLAEKQIEQTPEVKEYLLERKRQLSIEHPNKIYASMYAIPGLTVDEMMSWREPSAMYEMHSIAVFVRHGLDKLLLRICSKQLAICHEDHSIPPKDIPKYYTREIMKILSRHPKDCWYSLNFAIATQLTDIIDIAHAYHEDISSRHIGRAAATGVPRVLRHVLALYEKARETAPGMPSPDTIDGTHSFYKAIVANQFEVADMLKAWLNTRELHFDSIEWPSQAPITLQQVTYIVSYLKTYRNPSAIDLDTLAIAAAEQNYPEIIEYMMQMQLYIPPCVWEPVLRRKAHKFADLLCNYNVDMLASTIRDLIKDSRFDSLAFAFARKFALSQHLLQQIQAKEQPIELSKLLEPRIAQWKAAPTLTKEVISTDDADNKAMQWFARERRKEERAE
jgi:hypothetical protein